MRAQYESILPPDTSSFNAFVQVKPEFDYPFHYHPQYELTYILSSSGVRYVGNRFENFAENDLVMLGPNLPHCWKNIDAGSIEASALVIQWNEDLLGERWLEKKEFARIRQLHQLSVHGIRFPSKFALALKDELLHIVSVPAFEKIIMLVRILERLSVCEGMQTLCDYNFANNLKFDNNERLNTIYQYLKINYRNKITLSNVAAQVCMTDESFSRFFSKLMNKTFFSFLNEYRINVACKLLIESDLSIARICDQCGYESVSFFFRQFKRFKNCSPQYFRKQFQLAEGVL